MKLSAHRLRRVTAPLLALTAVAAVGATTAQMTSASANTPVYGTNLSNPLAGYPLGSYNGQADEVYPAYRAATGNAKVWIGRIALHPRTRWFGGWQSDQTIASSVHEYINNTTHGNPNVVSQMAVFRLPSSEGAACTTTVSAAGVQSYETWVNRFANAVGSSRVAMVLQPDLAVWGCGSRHNPIWNNLTAYAAQRFSQQPNIAVYIDAASPDWLRPIDAANMLRAAGVRYARGFALNATHYASTDSNIQYGVAVHNILQNMGMPYKHFVVNTSNNSHPFTYQQYYKKHPRGFFDNAEICGNRYESQCVSAGIPPTTHTADPSWGLTAQDRTSAARLADAYLWYGRSYLVNQNWPYSQQRTEDMGRTSPTYDW